MEHRGFEYGIRQTGDGQWEWTIYPRKERSGVVRGKVTGTREQAEMACKREIDLGLDHPSN